MPVTVLSTSQIPTNLILKQTKNNKPLWYRYSLRPWSLAPRSKLLTTTILLVIMRGTFKNTAQGWVPGTCNFEKVPQGILKHTKGWEQLVCDITYDSIITCNSSNIRWSYYCERLYLQFLFQFHRILFSQLFSRLTWKSIHPSVLGKSVSSPGSIPWLLSLC